MSEVIPALKQAGDPNAHAQYEAVSGTYLLRVTLVSKIFQNLDKTERNDYIWNIVMRYVDKKTIQCIVSIELFTPSEFQLKSELNLLRRQRPRKAVRLVKLG